jgi:hypothetical protein
MIEPAQFDRKFLGSESAITRIGTGTLGGKANGLVFIEHILRQHFGDRSEREIAVRIPRMFVIGADFFVDFMEQNDLYDIAHSNRPDDRIAHAFLKAHLPPKLVGDLRTVADRSHLPLAIRSSSLLEDALYRPFAGVYATKMVPNNQPGADVRFRKLREAIKFVYASTYFKAAKRYVNSIDEKIESEKMAVIIQDVFGQNLNRRFYPNISGIARSYNFYPTGHATPMDGVISLALGLGRTIVEGGRVWTYSPAYPKTPPPFNGIRDMLKQTQTSFWAINMGKPPAYDPVRETEYLIKARLGEAEYDNTHIFTASTFVPESNRIVPGVGQDGPRILNFARILELNDPPLNDLLKDLLTACEDAMGSEVEIEFAVVMDNKKGVPAKLGFLQVRPMVVMKGQMDLPADRLSGDDVLVATDSALGNHFIADIQDIVYVCRDTFEPAHTERVAMELESINATLKKDRKPYALIGFGRFGTSDPWRGIPVRWSQISNVRALVEVEIPGMETDLSQGSHFFHNVTSFKVSCFSVPMNSAYPIDWEWLENQSEIQRTEFVRHVRTSSPLTLQIDGTSGRGVILKNGGQ